MPAMTGLSGDIPFLKMHGLGNDFVIVDARGGVDPITPARARAMGDRNTGVGYDQLAVLHPGTGADVDVTFWNSDGTQAAACGNASRCITRLLTEETGRDAVTLRTERGLLPGRRAGEVFSVNMGDPLFDWQDIPLARAVDTAALPLTGAPVAVGMGNPHCIFFVDDADAVDPAANGPAVEHNPLFPQGTNVEFVSVLADGSLRMRVWERGAGITRACGSGACAVAVAAHRAGLAPRRVTVVLDGGALELDWRDDGVWMTGPASFVFSGTLAAEALP
ncbi:MAG: diaminopimelate epimerase [Pseudomonadota bacterium]